MKNKIIYTKTDEAPALATQSFLPIVKTFTATAGIQIQTRDISLAGRIIANFPENLKEEQKIKDALAELGELVKNPEANIIKLPNISASVPQLKAAIKELQDKGYDIPNFPEEPKTDEEQELRERFLKILGSAVNPILRQGNSDRRVAAPVKQYAKDNPHLMGEWVKDSKSHVSYMKSGDFYGSEKSVSVDQAVDVRIEHIDSVGLVTVLKEKIPLLKNEIIDSSVLSCKELKKFFLKEIKSAKEENVLLSLHMKTTMMKVSDPIIFGHAIKIFFKDVFSKFESIFEEIGIDAKNGLGDLFNKIQKLSKIQQNKIKNEIKIAYKNGPKLAMVDSDKGITNLHVPSDVIIDASMPAAIKTSGKMWGPDGTLLDTKYMIPDRCYAKIYEEIISFCKENGAFDITKMGSVSNIGLMAQKAEEYGSHDKTFEISKLGLVRVVDALGIVLMEHKVEAGDIFRMCQTKKEPIKDWVRLSVVRARATGIPTVFWLDENRAHDINLIKRVKEHLKEQNTQGLEIQILSPVKAINYTLKKVKEGRDVISVTGNVLRDYLTDLFPILELGTSSKMLSIVPLLAGGSLFETGAGGSAPKHVQQFVKENHLRWDSLGEFLALSVSIQTLAKKNNNEKALILAKALDDANGKFLRTNKSPSRKVRELDNRGSHFYLAMYWAEALAAQSIDDELKIKFSQIFKILKKAENTIINELNLIQGKTVDIGGYFLPNDELVLKAMRPSKTFNTILKSI